MKMLKAQLQFVKFDEVKGKNKEGNEFHFANATFSDGLESIELGLDLKQIPVVEDLKRGQKVEIQTDMRKQGYNWGITVKKIAVI